MCLSVRGRLLGDDRVNPKMLYLLSLTRLARTTTVLPKLSEFKQQLNLEIPEPSFFIIYPSIQFF